MSDLISRSRAKEDLLSWAVAINKPNLMSREDALTVLDIIPAVDAVEVVRCKDCKFQIKVFHEDKRRKEGGYWLYFCYRNEDQFVCHAVNGYDDEFCCYGEKKEGDSDDLRLHDS